MSHSGKRSQEAGRGIPVGKHRAGSGPVDHGRNQTPAPPYRPPARRNGPSGAWNRFGERIKPASLDPLDEYQLPSKGEKRLHDFRTQERYYAKIVERYMKFCADSGSSDEMNRAFESLSLDESFKSKPTALGDARQDAVVAQQPPEGMERQDGLSTILMAMRKLREGMLGSRRTDDFAQRAYMLIIHASVLARHWEAYHHALNYLLYNIHPVTPLTKPEMDEFVGYLILDRVCRQADFHRALVARQAFAHRDRKTFQILKAVMHKDWVAFWRLKRKVDGYQSALMQFAEGQMRDHALKCLGRSYMQAEKGFIERSTGSDWAVLKADGVAWQLQEDGRVVIRKPKPK